MGINMIHTRIVDLENEVTLRDQKIAELEKRLAEIQKQKFGYFHELLDVGSCGTGIWLGCNDLEILKKSAIPGETGEVIVTLYSDLS